jgi:lysophospholipase L1-like esterase
MNPMRVITAIIAGLLATTLAAHAPSSLAAEPQAHADELPKVLIIGDSISGGYTKEVARLLKGKAIVEHNPGNAEHTGTGLRRLDEWLGTTDWDVIHFNWGLWDLCYRHPESKLQGKRDKVNGTITTSIEVYEQNLDQLVTRLKKTNAVLIWAHTTVVPEGEPGRNVGDDAKYNAAAARVMEKHAVIVNDLHALTKEFEPKLFSKPGDVHFSGAGYGKLARQVAAAIAEAIE